MRRPILIGAETLIPLEYVSSEAGLIHHLTFENGQWHASKRSGVENNQPRYFHLAHIEGDYMAVPRAWDASEWLIEQAPIQAELLARSFWWPHTKLGTDNVVLGPNEAIRYDQSKAWEAISKRPDWPWGRILALGCGKGKTVLALKLAHLRAVPTIVVCHTINMMQTWSETAASDWCLKYPMNKHGFIGDGMNDWKGRDLVFTTMHGLLAREYPPEFWERFGLVIFDEGDLLGAVQMSRILPRFLGERLLLTATVERSDGHEVLYYHHVGKVVYEDTKPDLAPKVLVLDSPVPREMYGIKRYKRGGRWFTKKGMMPTEQTVQRGAMHVPHIPRTINKIRECTERFEWAFDAVAELLFLDRKILFLGERVDELKLLHQRTQEELYAYKSGLALGKKHMKPALIATNLQECDVIWAIQHLAKRGLNQPDIDTVVIQYASFQNPGRLRQTIGRALRYQKGKKEPLVIIMNDARVPIINEKAMSLARELEGEGYELEWYEDEEM